MTEFEYKLSQFLFMVSEISHLSPEEMAQTISKFVWEQGGDGDCVVFARSATKNEIAEEFLKIHSWEVRENGDEIILVDNQEFIVIREYGKPASLPNWISGIFIC
jgi:hypothetical protein